MLKYLHYRIGEKRMIYDFARNVLYIEKHTVVDKLRLYTSLRIYQNRFVPVLH